MHGQFLWFSARIEIFLSKNFPPFLNFASLSVVSLSSIQSHIQLAKIFLDESFFFSRETKKQNSIRFQTNFTDYKYFLPAILSINRKIKKKKKEEAIYSSSKSRERKSKPTVFTITRSIYFSPLHPSLPPPSPPHSQHEQFLFLRVSCAFYFIPRPPSSCRKSVFRPLTSIKPKACCIPRFSSPVGRSRGHFDRANCLNPRALFAKLCTVPRKLSPSLPLLTPYRTPSTTPFRSSPSSFLPSANSIPRVFTNDTRVAKRRKTRGIDRWSTVNRDETTNDEGLDVVTLRMILQ